MARDTTIVLHYRGKKNERTLGELLAMLQNEDTRLEAAEQLKPFLASYKKLGESIYDEHAKACAEIEIDPDKIPTVYGGDYLHVDFLADIQAHKRIEQAKREHPKIAKGNPGIKPRTAEEKIKLCEDFEASGKSQPGFCAYDTDVSVATLQRYLRWYRKEKRAANVK